MLFDSLIPCFQTRRNKTKQKPLSFWNLTLSVLLLEHFQLILTKVDPSLALLFLVLAFPHFPDPPNRVQKRNCEKRLPFLYDKFYSFTCPRILLISYNITVCVFILVSEHSHLVSFQYKNGVDVIYVGKALMSIKASLRNVENVLLDWDDLHNQDFCSWRGVFCDNARFSVLSLYASLPNTHAFFLALKLWWVILLHFFTPFSYC